jgi:hypothetical protein
MSTVQSPQQSPEVQKREGQRRLCSFGLIGAGIVIAWIGVDYVIGGILPVPVFGLIVSGMGVLGLLGVNVFAGGPLDRNRDPK